MALRLEIISAHRQKLGSRGNIVLGVAGGSIGRALDNDWALPDSNRFLSGHHARIHFRAGHYIVEDTSSNGVYVNDATKPLGKRGIHRLGAGDILRMGEYRVLVQIDEDDLASVTPPGATTMASLAVHNVLPLRVPGSHRRAENQDDLGHSLDIAALLPDQAFAPAEHMAVAARAVLEPAAALSAEAPPAPTPAPPPVSLQDRLNRLRAAAKARLEGTSPAPALQNGLQAFCRGAGLDVEKLPMASDAEALQLAGRLLREALLGLKEIQRAQASFSAQYGIAGDAPDGPALSELGSDEYLLELLAGHDKRRLDAVLRLREQFAATARHADAMDPALRAALALFIGHLDPARMDGLPPETRWTRYRELYANLQRSGAGEAPPPLFIEALAQAYLEARDRATLG